MRRQNDKTQIGALNVHSIRCVTPTSTGVRLLHSVKHEKIDQMLHSR